MMPPTSIDGTDITGATIDGTDVQEITVDGQTVFSAVEPADIDGFETGNINNYTVNTAGFSASTNNVFEGSFCVEAPGDSSIVTSNPPGGTLPSFGVDFEFYIRTNGGGSPGLAYESSGAISQNNGYDGYFIRLAGGNTLQVCRATPGDLDGNGISFQSVSGGFVDDRWYNMQVTFSGSTATYELIDTTTNNVVATITDGAGAGQGTKMGLTSFGDRAAIDSIRTL